MTMKRLWKAGMIAGLALGLVAAGAASAQDDARVLGRRQPAPRSDAQTVRQL